MLLGKVETINHHYFLYLIVNCQILMWIMKTHKNIHTDKYGDAFSIQENVTKLIKIKKALKTGENRK